MRRNCLTLPKSLVKEARFRLLVSLNNAFLIFSDSYPLMITILLAMLAQKSKMRMLYKKPVQLILLLNVP